MTNLHILALVTLSVVACSRQETVEQAPDARRCQLYRDQVFKAYESTLTMASITQWLVTNCDIVTIEKSSDPLNWVVSKEQPK